VALQEARRPSRFRTLSFGLQLLRLGATTIWIRLTWPFTPDDSERYIRFARYVRDFLYHLGTVGIKLGQILAMRSDLLPPAFATEMAKLRDVGKGVPFPRVQKSIEKELGTTIAEHFEEFHETPFAATSSFQVHRARLRREQVWVAVKVLRPFAQETFARDIFLLRRITGWLKFLRIYPHMRWQDMCREVEEAGTRELDLRFEAAALRQLQQNLPKHGVYVPEVFADYSGKHVLTMEFIHATLMSDIIEMKKADPERLALWLEENNIQPRKLARRLFHSVWRQILEDNFFHADLHPNNVIVLRDNRLAVIDCRSAGELEAETHVKHRRYVEAMADAEYTTAAEYLFLLMARLPRVDLGEVKSQFARVWRRWENQNYVSNLSAAEKSLTRMLDSLNRIMFRYGFEVQWSLARLIWTIINADTSILHLAEDVNYVHWLRQYFAAANRRRNRIKPSELAERAARTVAAMVQLPKSMAADSIAQQEILRRQARVFHGSTTKTGHFLATLYSFLATGLLVLIAFCLCAFLSQHYEWKLVSALGPQLSTVVNALPHFSWWLWIFVLLLIAYLHRHCVLAKRGHLRQDLGQQPNAGPAI
jgi:ubiquinone biosynthesis protein